MSTKIRAFVSIIIDDRKIEEVFDELKDGSPVMGFIDEHIPDRGTFYAEEIQNDGDHICGYIELDYIDPPNKTDGQLIFKELIYAEEMVVLYKEHFTKTKNKGLYEYDIKVGKDNKVYLTIELGDNMIGGEIKDYKVHD